MRPRVPPLLVVLTTALLMWLSRWLVPAFTVRIPAGFPLAAASAVLAAIVITVALTSFRRARTTVNPLEPGQASTLVATGVYRYSRNPMYLGFALLLGAWAILLSNLVALLLVPLFVLYMNRFQIALEEEALEARFGPAYSAYRREVRRWL